MQLVLSINLGNEAMQTPEDVAMALINSARAIQHHDEINCKAAHIVRDRNGNAVGKWEVIEEPAKPQAKQVWALAIDGNHIGTEASIFTSELKLYEHLAEAMDPTDEERETIGAYVAANDAAGLAEFVTDHMEVPDLFTYQIESTLVEL